MHSCHTKIYALQTSCIYFVTIHACVKVHKEMLQEMDKMVCTVIFVVQAYALLLLGEENPQTKIGIDSRQQKQSAKVSQ